jgi:hypothetical protein
LDEKTSIAQESWHPCIHSVRLSVVPAFDAPHTALSVVEIEKFPFA